MSSNMMGTNYGYDTMHCLQPWQRYHSTPPSSCNANPANNGKKPMMSTMSHRGGSSPSLMLRTPSPPLQSPMQHRKLSAAAAAAAAVAATVEIKIDSSHMHNSYNSHYPNNHNYSRQSFDHNDSYYNNHPNQRPSYNYNFRPNDPRNNDFQNISTPEIFNDRFFLKHLEIEPYNNNSYPHQLPLSPITTPIQRHDNDYLPTPYQNQCDVDRNNYNSFENGPNNPNRYNDRMNIPLPKKQNQEEIENKQDKINDSRNNLLKKVKICEYKLRKQYEQMLMLERDNKELKKEVKKLKQNNQFDCAEVKGSIVSMEDVTFLQSKNTGTISKLAKTSNAFNEYQQKYTLLKKKLPYINVENAKLAKENNNHKKITQEYELEIIDLKEEIKHADDRVEDIVNKLFNACESRPDKIDQFMNELNRKDENSNHLVKDTSNLDEDFIGPKERDQQVLISKICQYAKLQQLTISQLQNNNKIEDVEKLQLESSVQKEAIQTNQKQSAVIKTSIRDELILPKQKYATNTGRCATSENVTFSDHVEEELFTEDYKEPEKQYQESKRKTDVSNCKKRRKSKTIALVLVQHGKSLKHTSFADLIKIGNISAEIRWHDGCWKAIVPLENVFVVRKDENDYDNAPLKKLVAEGIFEVDVNFDSKDDSKVSHNDAEYCDLALGKRKSVKCDRYTPIITPKQGKKDKVQCDQPSPAVESLPNSKIRSMNDIPVRRETTDLFFCDSCWNRFENEEEALRCDCS